MLLGGLGVAHCDTSGSLIDRCRQGSWQQVDCSYFSCTVDGGEKTPLSCDESVGLRVQRHRLIKGEEEEGVCVCVFVPGRRCFELKNGCQVDSDL